MSICLRFGAFPFSLQGGEKIRMKKKKTQNDSIEIDSPAEEPAQEEAEPEKRPKGGFALKALRLTFKAAGFTVDAVVAVIGSIFKVLGSIMLIFLMTGILFTCVFAYYVKTCLTPELDISLEDFQLSESSTIWYQDTDGAWKELVTLAGSQNRKWVDYEDIPKYMEQALVAIEDKRFYEHKGVDWYRTSGAFVEVFGRMESGYGGSTITQQLIKNTTGRSEVTIQRKLSEIFGALEREKKYNKEEIIEWYMNAVYFGEGCYGVQTAAQTYFGKDVSDLSLAEAAAIVGITNLPTYYDPFYNEQNNEERQETILHEMYEQGYIDYAQYRAAVDEELVFTHGSDEQLPTRIYSYYEETVMNDVIGDLMELKGIAYEQAQYLLYNGGYQIYCCLDPAIQAKVDSVYTDLSQIPHTRGSSQQLQSAIVIMDPYDGRILALSGGVGEKTSNLVFNRADGSIKSGPYTRSPGSSIKPIAAYGPAVEAGLITPNTLVNDSPNIRLSGTSWYTANAGGGYSGIITIAQALRQSINTVSAQIVDKLTPQRSYDFLVTRLGFKSIIPEDAGYAAMALGQLNYGLTVREMAQAYCSFVNDGIFTYSRTYTMVTDSNGNIVIDNSPETIVAFSPNTAYTMTYMLKGAVEGSGGTGYEARLSNMAVAGKTGSTSDYKDRWFVGCTPYYVAAVWTGYDIPEYINVNGNPAAQLWKKVMGPVHEGLPYKDFTWPYIGGNTGIFGLDESDIEDEYADDGEDDGEPGHEGDVIGDDYTDPGSDTNPGGNNDDHTGGSSGDDYTGGGDNTGGSDNPDDGSSDNSGGGDGSDDGGGDDEGGEGIIVFG